MENLGGGWYPPPWVHSSNCPQLFNSEIYLSNQSSRTYVGGPEASNLICTDRKNFRKTVVVTTPLT